MRWLSLLTLLPLALALPNPQPKPLPHKVETLKPKLAPRASDLAPQILSEIQVLNTSVTALTAAVTAFDASLLDLLPASLKVVSAELKLDATIVKTTQLAKQSAPFTEEESTQIVETLASLITPIGASLTALSDKYPEFKKTIIEAPIVLLDLKTLKAHTDDLIAALTPKVTSDWTGFLGLGQSVLDADFDAAIAVYSA